MYWISKSIHLMGRFKTRLFLFLIILGPGMITMIADNDAGGISTYAVTGSKHGFNLLWAFYILVPMASLVLSFSRHPIRYLLPVLLPLISLLFDQSAWVSY